MLLGQVLERLGDEMFAAETLVALEDLRLMVDVQAAGRQFGESIGEYASGASRRFAMPYGHLDPERLALDLAPVR